MVLALLESNNNILSLFEPFCVTCMVTEETLFWAEKQNRLSIEATEGDCSMEEEYRGWEGFLSCLSLE